MKHKFKIGLYEEDPFELVSKNFQKEMSQIHGNWWTGMDDRIYTKTSHAGETRYALRVYPDEFDNPERDIFLKDMNDNNICFFCDSPGGGFGPKTRFNFSGFWEAQNYFAETTQLLDYDIHNVYEFDDGKLNGLYFSFAEIRFDQIYERFCEDLWDSAEKVFDEKKLNKYFEKFHEDKKVFKEFFNTLHFLNPSLNIYQSLMSDCELIDEIGYPLFKSKVEFYASQKNYNNLSLDEILYDQSPPLYFVFETGFFINNAKNGVFERFSTADNSQKIVSKQYKDDVLEKELAENYKINKYPHIYQHDF